MLVGQNVIVELAEERKAAAKVADRQFVGVREDVGWDATLAQLGVQFYHRLDRGENVGKEFAELFDGSAKSGGRLHFGEKLLLADLSGLEPKEQGGMVDEFLHCFRRHPAAGRDSPAGDAVIEIHEDFAEIENDCFGFRHGQWISRRPSSARLSVSSSANSNPLPAGRP